MESYVVVFDTCIESDELKACKFNIYFSLYLNQINLWHGIKF